MLVLQIAAVLILSYLVGSIPVGWLIVKISTGRDVRTIESGRTGGTNVMRAAGTFAGVLTAIGDVLKGYSTLWIVNWLTPPDSPWKVWLQVAAPLLAILGHNYSIYLLERRADGKVQLRGGAGGATCFGGALGLWLPSGLIILPVGLLVFLLVGYASLTTISIALSATVIFAYLALFKGYPWQYILYGAASLMALLWALRPNLARLANGTERVVGLRAFLQKKRTAGKKQGAPTRPVNKKQNATH
jgi:glycerol-3-phosphate acyltransferase PlsY